MFRPGFFAKAPDADSTIWRVHQVEAWDTVLSTTGDATAARQHAANGLRYDDADYAYNDGTGDGLTSGATFSMAAITDPGVDTGFSIKIKHEGRSAAAALRVYILNESDVSINGSWYSPSLVLNTPTEESIVLNAADVANIGDFSDVKIKLLSVHPDAWRVYYLYIETP